MRDLRIEKEAAIELTKAIEIVKSLADGRDPRSHKTLSRESGYQDADTVRALYTALSVMEENHRRQESTAQLPSNANRPWDDSEDKRLCDELHHAVPSMK
jgi:hypothetical protein